MLSRPNVLTPHSTSWRRFHEDVQWREGPTYSYLEHTRNSNSNPRTPFNSVRPLFFTGGLTSLGRDLCRTHFAESPGDSSRATKKHGRITHFLVHGVNAGRGGGKRNDRGEPRENADARARARSWACERGRVGFHENSCRSFEASSLVRASHLAESESPGRPCNDAQVHAEQDSLSSPLLRLVFSVSLSLSLSTFYYLPPPSTVTTTVVIIIGAAAR